MPIDPSKIKLEKNPDPEHDSAITVDLSIVKKEKEEALTLPCTASVKVEKVDSYNSENQQLDRTENNKMGKSDLVKTSNLVAQSRNSQEEKILNGPPHKKEISHPDKPLKETSSHNSHSKEKDVSKMKDVKERRKSNCERRSSSDGVSNDKSVRRVSTDSRKSHKELSSSTIGNERRTSTEKNKDSVTSTHKDPKPKAMSMFDLVAASIKPSKPKILKEISIFDTVSAVGYESDSGSSGISDQDTQEISNDDKNPSHDTGFEQVKGHSSPKEKSLENDTDRYKSQSKSDKGSHSHQSSSSHSKSKSHRDKESLVKRSHSSVSSSSVSKHSHSSSKHKSRSHSYSGTHSSKSKSSGSTGIGTDSKDLATSPSNKLSHSSSSKSKESKSSSHHSKVSHSRKHSTSSNDRVKEHKSKDHKKKENSKKENRNGKISSKEREDSKEDGISKKDPRSKHEIKSKHEKEKSRREKSVTKDSSEADEVSSNSDRELCSTNDNNGDDDEGDCDDDGDEGNSSPFPDLSALDEISQDDWEQMINSSSDDLKHLENLRSEEDFDLDDFDKEDPDIMEECLQMYNEYKPDPAENENQISSKKKMKVEANEETEPLPGKQRVARTTSVGNMIPQKSNSDLKIRKKTPAQVMMERYQKLKEQQAELLKQLERQKQQLEEQGKSVAGVSTSSAVSSSTSCRSKSTAVSSCSVSSTTSARFKIAPASSTSAKSPHSTTGTPKRRMSHVPNVASLLQAREKIKSLPPSSSRNLLSPSLASASGRVPPTIAQTVAKGGKRLAHTPKLETLQRPTITPEFGSKVPPNIRQRYLNSLIDECLKFLGEKEAYNLGLAEERVCFQRATSRMVYLNLAVNAVKRLRNQQEAGEAAQELLDTDPSFKENTFIEDASSSEKPSTSGISSTSSPSTETKHQHPVNPNHSRLSHFSVLAGGGHRGSWSIEKPKKNAVNVQNYLKGANFYQYLKKYILTEQQLEENGYPSPDPDEKGKAVVKAVDTRKKLSPSSVERYCDRCSVLYTVDKWGFPLSIGPCVHHWGRPFKKRGYSGWETRYSCCNGDLESEGCSQATTHVSQNYDPNNLRGYVRTLPKDVKDSDCGVYALDCEMCYTTGGSELTRITVIDTDGKPVYEQLVKPENPIIDYNTRFSGITESDMEDVKTSIRDVQASLLAKFSDKTILIGHSLESDFHALKLIHDTVVDTSVVFPHKMGPPYKRALKNLASEYLKKIIQNDVSGHDSAEDAVTCMHLMQWRIKEDLKGFGQK